MNLKKCLLLVFVTINILMHAIIADFQEIESRNSTSSTQIPEICNLNQNTGFCSECYRGRCYRIFGQNKRYAYNIYIDECVPFSYGGCGGNANNFKSMAVCEATCLGKKTIVTSSSLMYVVIGHPQEILSQNFTSPTQNSKICNLRLDVGLCTECYRGRCYSILNQNKRYAYNKYIDECEPFSYGDCGGNANNFISRADCEATCFSLERKKTNEMYLRIKQYFVNLGKNIKLKSRYDDTCASILCKYNN